MIRTGLREREKEKKKKKLRRWKRGESLTEGLKRMKMEGVKWHRGAERWNHNAEGIRETGYIILLCPFFLFGVELKG